MHFILNNRVYYCAEAIKNIDEISLNIHFVTLINKILFMLVAYKPMANKVLFSRPPAFDLPRIGWRNDWVWTRLDEASIMSCII